MANEAGRAQTESAAPLGVADVWFAEGEMRRRERAASVLEHSTGEGESPVAAPRVAESFSLSESGCLRVQPQCGW